MHNPEIPQHPEINVNELLEIIKKIKYENGEEFSYNNTNYFLIIFTDEDVQRDKDAGGEGELAFYSESTLIDGFDIYLYAGFKGIEKERRMFHEILEVDLIKQGFADEAHQLAQAEEEKIYGKR